MPAVSGTATSVAVWTLPAPATFNPGSSGRLLACQDASLLTSFPDGAHSNPIRILAVRSAAVNGKFDIDTIADGHNPSDRRTCSSNGWAVSRSRIGYSDLWVEN